MVRAAGLCLLMAGTGAPVAAQAPPAEPRVELSVSGVVTGGYDLGGRPATQTRNQIGGGAFVLFETSTEMRGGEGLEARFGFRVTPRVTVEAGGAWMRADLVTRITDDAEAAPATEAGTTITQYVLDGGILFALRRPAPGRRLMPFVGGGAGYLHQLPEENTIVETGAVYHAGGGLYYWLRSRPRGWLRQAGLRVDGRFVVRTGGFDIESETRRRYLLLGGGVILRF